MKKLWYVNLVLDGFLEFPVVTKTEIEAKTKVLASLIKVGINPDIISNVSCEVQDDWTT